MTHGFIIVSPELQYTYSFCDPGPRPLFEENKETLKGHQRVKAIFIMMETIFLIFLLILKKLGYNH